MCDACACFLMYFSREVCDISFLFFVPLRRAVPQRSSQPRKGEAREICKWSFLGTTVEFSCSITARTRFPECVSLPQSPLPPRRFPSAHFSFSKLYPRRRRTSSLHFLLCPFSRVFSVSPPDTLYFRFYLYFRFPFTYHSEIFATTTYLPPRSSCFCTLNFLDFLFLCYLHFFHIAISLRALSLPVTEFCTFPSGIVLRFLRRQRRVYSSCSTSIRLPE